MLYIIWSKADAIDVPIIDEQHRAIVAVINTLHYHAEKGKGEVELRKDYKILEQLSYLHFETEEMLMKEKKFEGYEEHVKYHKNFSVKLKEISEGDMHEKDTYQVLKYLKEWWSEHINEADRKYVPWLK